MGDDEQAMLIAIIGLAFAGAFFAALGLAFGIIGYSVGTLLGLW